jgi:hypothetical protein
MRIILLPAPPGRLAGNDQPQRCVANKFKRTSDCYQYRTVMLSLSKHLYSFVGYYPAAQ